MVMAQIGSEPKRLKKQILKELRSNCATIPQMESKIIVEHGNVDLSFLVGNELQFK